MSNSSKLMKYPKIHFFDIYVDSRFVCRQDHTFPTGYVDSHPVQNKKNSCPKVLKRSQTIFLAPMFHTFLRKITTCGSITNCLKSVSNPQYLSNASTVPRSFELKSLIDTLKDSMAIQRHFHQTRSRFKVETVPRAAKRLKE